MSLVKISATTVLNTDAIEIVTDFNDHIGLRFRSGVTLRVDGPAAQAIRDSFPELQSTELVEEVPSTINSFWTRLKEVFGG